MSLLALAYLVLPVAAALTVATMFFRRQLPNRGTDTGWQIYHAQPWTKIVFADGSSQYGGDVARRQAGGMWQYRRLTEAEDIDCIDRHAW